MSHQRREVLLSPLEMVLGSGRWNQSSDLITLGPYSACKLITEPSGWKWEYQSIWGFFCFPESSSCIRAAELVSCAEWGRKEGRKEGQSSEIWAWVWGAELELCPPGLGLREQSAREQEALRAWLLLQWAQSPWGSSPGFHSALPLPACLQRMLWALGLLLALCLLSLHFSCLFQGSTVLNYWIFGYYMPEDDRQLKSELVLDAV